MDEKMEEGRARKCCGGRGGCVTKCWRRLWTSRFASSLRERKRRRRRRRKRRRRREEQRKTIRWHTISFPLPLTLVWTGCAAGGHFRGSHLPRTSGRRAARGRD